jgi:hypothetical protein
MFVSKRSTRFAYAAVVMINVMALSPLDARYRSQDHGLAHEPSGHGDEDRDQGGRKSPCDPAHRDHGKRFDKRCIGVGSSSGIAKGDFNHDGIGDLAIGVPDKDVNTMQAAGAVSIIYGSASGLTPGGIATGVPLNQQITQNSAGETVETAESFDRFGASLAAGDFNGDGVSDLAVGIPGEVHGGFVGGVEVFFGAAATAGSPGQLGKPGGLTTDGAQIFYASDFAQGNGLGTSLAWGLFNNDTVGDLAIGAPNGGFVVVLTGLKNVGLTTSGFQLQAFPGPVSSFALTAGDFNGDGKSDLAVGTPTEAVVVQATGTVIERAGVVRVFYASPTGTGIDFANVQLWDQSRLSASDGAEKDDRFGAALAAGDFNCDSISDLAIGVPFEGLVDAVGNALPSAGAVNVVYGSSTAGLNDTGNQFWHQAKPGIPGKAEAGDQFGFALAAGKFGSIFGCSDLAIGVPQENFDDGTPTVSNSGAVNVIYGSASGLVVGGSGPFSVPPSQFLHQNTPGIQDEAEQDDLFGFSLTAWDFNGDGVADLVIGVPFEDVVNSSGVETLDAGLVHVIYGSRAVPVTCCPITFSQGGLKPNTSQVWHQDTPGIAGTGQAADHFGLTVY